MVIASIEPINAAESAEITLTRSLDVPDRTVSFENQTFNIVEIGNYKINQDIGFTVDAPGVDEMLVILYDRYRLSVWFERFNSTNGRVVGVIPANKTGESGTYALTVSHNRSIISAIPIVISDYTISVVPEGKKTTAGKVFDVDVIIKNKKGIPVNVENTVKVVLAQGSSSIETNVTNKKIGEYVAHIEIPQSSNGTFSLYSVITTERKVYMNYPEILGVQSGGYIEIMQPSAEKAPMVNAAVMVFLLICARFFVRKNYEL
ncbi:MAG: hypothetical protein OIN87_02020 [Candidatus Methanoperedens sp.]|nr:hypothetical protein [Candidatus Methanoperedens sp.]